MASYASPFFQNIVSLTENCIPLPPTTTYQSEFLSPDQRKQLKGNDKVSIPTQTLLHSLNLVKDGNWVPVKAQYCSPKAFEKSTIYKKDASNKNLCSKRITTYMVDYQNPNNRKKLYELRELNKVEEPPVEQEVLGNDELGKNCQETICASSNKTENLKEEINENKIDEQRRKAINTFTATNIFKEKEITPQWKIDGWNAKKNCWLRPLEERQEYYNSLEVNKKIKKPYKS